MKRRALLAVLPMWLVAACDRVAGINLLTSKKSAAVPPPTASRAITTPSPGVALPSPTASLAIQVTPLSTKVPTPALVVASPSPGAATVAQPSPVPRLARTEAPTLGSIVNTYTGSYSYAHIDIATSGPLPGIQFLRTYNSNDTRTTPLGPGWTHSYNMRIEVWQGKNGFVVVGPQGRSDVYSSSAPGVLDPPPGVDARLALESGGFSLTRSDGRIFSFSDHGLLLKDTDPAGRATVLAHDPTTGLLATVADPSGRGKLSLAYDAKGRLISVSDWLNPPRIFRYGYDDPGRLSTVTDREGKVTRYGYVGTEVWLESITDANGHVAVRNTYDQQGREVARRDARARPTDPGITTKITLNADGTQTTLTSYPSSSFEPTWRTTITDTYDKSGRVVRRETRTGSKDVPLVEEWTYDNHSFQIGSLKSGGTVDPPINGTPVSDPSTIVAEAAGSFDSEMVTQGLIDPTYLVRAVVSQMVDQSAETDDPFGRAESLNDPNAPDAATSLVQISYDREDRPVAILGALATRTARPVQRFRYDAVGNVVESISPEGLSATFVYDERDGLVEARMPDGEFVHYEHDDRGYLSRVRLGHLATPDERVIDFAFDGLRRLRRTTVYPNWPDKSGAIIHEYSYDQNGQTGAYSVGA